MAAQLLIVWLLLYAGISRQAASVVSRALKAILNHALARTPTSLPSSKRFNIDIRMTIKSMAISPTLERVLCYYRCLALYAPDTDETHCTWREVSGARKCGESLWKHRWGGVNASKLVPNRLYTYQTMQSWLEFMLSLPSFEDIIDSSHSEVPREIIHCTDVRESCMWQEMGKKVSMGVIILACLNLPPDLRNKSEYLFIVGILPGSREPSVVIINNILQPHIDELQRPEAGVAITTPKHPGGRDIRVRIGPVIADLVGLRKVTGCASHSAMLFCSFCKLRRRAMASSDPQKWVARSHREVMKASVAWNKARSLVRREDLVKKNGVRFSLVHRLSYRDSVKHNVIGIIHNWLEGVLQHHLRKRSGLVVSRSIRATRAEVETVKDGSTPRTQRRGDNEETRAW